MGFKPFFRPFERIVADDENSFVPREYRIAAHEYKIAAREYKIEARENNFEAREYEIASK